jgi:hypothetical protein
VSDTLTEGSASAPDVAGTVDAWRVWRVVARGERYLLGSMIKPTIWPPLEPLRAECLCPRPPLAWLRRQPRHPAPAEACECGIYAADLDQIGPYLNGSSTDFAVARVLGRVALWGTVVECERGLRATYAYPQRIFVPADACHDRRRGEAGELADGLAAYGVPVELLRAERADALLALGRRVA